MKTDFILWTSGIDNFILENNKESRIGGIQVQMYMWGQILSQNSWNVISFTNNKQNSQKELGNIQFRFFPFRRFINPVLSLIYTIYYVLSIRPAVILLNGATRDLLFISLISRIRKIKVIEMFASDSDLEPGKELINSKPDRLFYRLGVRITDNFIVQNAKQTELLKKNYHKHDPLEIPLIWIEKKDEPATSLNKDKILWVSNFRKLKRPEWFIRLAKENSDHRFVMVGHGTDKELFAQCRKEASEVKNMDFMGGLSFSEANKLFKTAFLFVCTSEIEGFPNTFLQAWINNCPIITTFDPSDLIKTHQLGIYCANYEEVKVALEKYKDEVFYKSVQENIQDYFGKNFDPQLHYEKLIRKFNISSLNNVT